MSLSFKIISDGQNSDYYSATCGLLLCSLFKLNELVIASAETWFRKIGFNEDDTNKSSSILIYKCTMQSVYTQNGSLMQKIN